MAKFQFLFLSAAICYLLVPARAEATCYYPDGTTIAAQSPCNSTIPISACCDPLDSCSISGLCLGRTGFNYRGSCTDSTWTSPFCPPLCHKDPILGTSYSGFTAVFPCDPPGEFSATFCCYSPAGNCCNSTTFNYGTTGNAFKTGNDAFLAAFAEANSSAKATVTVTTTATIVSGSQSTGGTESNMTKAQKSSSSVTGATIGAAVGVPLGLLAIGVIGFLIWRERKNGRPAGLDRRMIKIQTGGKECYAPGVLSAPPPQSDQTSWDSRTVTTAKNSTSELPNKNHNNVHEMI